MRTAPGEERLQVRAAFQGITGARKSRVLALVGLAAILLAVLAYGIATSGRARRVEGTPAADVTPGSGGEWLHKIPDAPPRMPGPLPSPPPKSPAPPVEPRLPPMLLN